MPLADHLRELRNRLIKSVIAVIITAVVGWVFSDWIIHQLADPLCDIHSVHGIGASSRSECGNGSLVMSGIMGGLAFKFKISLMVGVILACPVWSYQVWGFIAPGLYSKEKKYGLGFVAAGVPLFLAGVGLAYWLLPKALHILLSFNSSYFSTQILAPDYLDFIIRLSLVFGIAFEIPVLLVLLNFIGILKGKRLLRWWRGAVVLIFVFAAVATPTGDPFTMTALAAPLCVLYFAATFVALANDKRKERNNPDSELDDDEAADISSYMDDGDDLTAIEGGGTGSVTAVEEVRASELEGPEELPAPRRSDYDDNDDIT
ncbi:twin arginine-targeting protein translocase TatC [Mangrovactinospora gilvigrisea]|uniref:Sec-independent protein translocase protein TatC n=1 Tax=Mangrovactinospora gilvigrisea TaxID=1428644 RepID=A0A1J7BIC6_9ACTN|nr:twin-arginine translocase subunit TatC [Mangrovactinospora gilvigrisea]OIV38398.1 twin arginine-targeting protein translocase TatC [Mangrovactinospora gilvigrisea]